MKVTRRKEIFFCLHTKSNIITVYYRGIEHPCFFVRIFLRREPATLPAVFTIVWAQCLSNQSSCIVVRGKSRRGQCPVCAVKDERILSDHMLPKRRSAVCDGRGQQRGHAYTPIDHLSIVVSGLHQMPIDLRSDDVSRFVWTGNVTTVARQRTVLGE